MLQPLTLIEPESVAEACSELARLGDAAKVYAGGVELLLLLRQQLTDAECLVNIKRIPGLGEIRWDGQAVHLGATATHRDIQTSELAREHLPLMVAAERHVGNVRVRNQGTVGGNLCFADPHSDPGTALLIHEARVVVAGREGMREVAMEEFMMGSYTVALDPDELLVDVVAPALDGGWKTAYMRLEQFYRPTLNVAAAGKVDGGRFEAVRLAAGCVGPKPIRLRHLESRLQGGAVAEAREIIEGATDYLAEVLEPVGDLLGSAEYKLYMAKTYIRRCLEQLAADA